MSARPDDACAGHGGAAKRPGGQHTPIFELLGCGGEWFFGGLGGWQGSFGDSRVKTRRLQVK